MRALASAPIACFFLILLSTSVPAHAVLPLTGEDGGIPTLAPLLKQVTPAVVNISVQSRSALSENPLMRDPFFRRFFDLPERAPVPPKQSAGSGVIVDAARGYVLTNHHVIESADEIAVTLKDRRTFTAQLVGSDPGTDIALLKIDSDDLSDLEIGDSDDLEVGDFVIAIGNPFGLGQTVTSGIVSALGRSGLNIEGYEDFIQTDASINPGNSGGALVSLKGELIGINTAIIGPAGGNVGIGFAVPSNIAMAAMAQLVSYGEIRRGRLGIMIQDLTPDLAEALGTEMSDGAVVSQVEPGSPAERSGIRAGDVIVAVDDHEISNAADLRTYIGLVPIGEEVRLIVLSEGKRKAIKARIGESKSESLAGGDALPQLAGAVFTNIGPGTPLFGKVEGVLIEELEKGSSAWRYGLREDDVIVAVNRVRVRSLREFSQVLVSAGRSVAFNILRGGAQVFIVIR